MIKTRPYVICHMTVSMDGKCTGSFLNADESQCAINEYYRIHRDKNAEAFACGRVTMEESFTKGWYPDLKEFESKPMKRTDYIADQNAKRYAVAFDTHGKLGWKASVIEDDDPGYDQSHVIEILSEDVSDAYLAYLQSIHVSYLFAGKHEIDVKEALHKLWSTFFIETLLLEGGSVLNGSFERAELIDEVSLVQAPVIADSKSKSLFENSTLSSFVLKEVQILSSEVVYMTYLTKEANARRVKMSCLLEAIELASDSARFYYDTLNEENVALFECDNDEELEELIDENPERFIGLPDAYDLHEYEFMEQFVDSLSDARLQNELEYAICGKGAFRRFKTIIHQKNIQDQWYQFLEQAHRQFAMDWCKERGLQCILDK